MGIGVHVKFKVHSPIKIDTFADPQELANLVEKTITEDIQY